MSGLRLTFSDLGFEVEIAGVKRPGIPPWRIAVTRPVGRLGSLTRPSISDHRGPGRCCARALRHAGGMMRDWLLIVLGPASVWLASDLCRACGPPAPSIAA